VSEAWTWSLDSGQCVGCGVCADVCATAAIRLTPAMPLPEPVPGRCMGCHDCVRECPTAAIAVRPGASEVLPGAEGGRGR